MQNWLRLLLSIALVANLPVGWEQPPLNAAGPAPQVEAELVAAAKARADAYARGDCSAWAQFVSPEFRFIDQSGHATTREQQEKECEPGKNSPRNERVLSDFHSQIQSDLAFVDYRYDESERWGTTEIKKTFRQLDTFQRRQGKWLVVYAIRVQIFDDPVPAKLDPSTYDTYVGRYALNESVIDTVTRQGDTLFIRAPDEPSPTELLPERADTFFVRGDPTRFTFVRDGNGKVILLDAHLPEHRLYQEKRLN